MDKEYRNYLTSVRKYPNNTVNSYLSDITIFKEYLSSLKINYLKVDKDIIREYLKVLGNSNYKSSSINRILSSLKNYYDYLEYKHLIEYNPLKDLNRPKKEKRLPNFINNNDYEEIIKKSLERTDFIGRRNTLLLELLYSSGIRISEAINIKIKDINISDKSIRILGKGSKMRIVYFGEYAKEYLEEYLKVRNSSLEYLFLNKNNTPLTRRGAEYIVSNLVKTSLLKKKVTPHTFRHSYATEMLNNGADIRSVQELLGHSSLSTTGIYTHVTNEVVRREYLKAFKR